MKKHNQLVELAEKDRSWGTKRERTCHSCGTPAFFSTEFMLVDRVWLKANLGNMKGFMHLTCVEEVLNRKLTIEDFTPVAMNYPIFFGYDMGRKSK